MPHLPKMLAALSRLLSYPDQHTSQAAELLFVVLQHELPEAATYASQFGDYVEQHEPWEVEESFTRTFDVNPACALEVGWHLFGEEYARGMFLVRMRESLRKFGLPESTELPDHISHVLAIIAAMPDHEATRFVEACVQPAVEKMDEALNQKETPYRFVVACLAAVIRHRWGTCKSSAQTDAHPSDARGTDPLRDFPVAGIGLDPRGCQAECGATCDDKPHVVPLNATFPPNPSLEAQTRPTRANETRNL